ncbi:MAG: rhomboid family intramembrane serine protease [Bacillus sp. (in: firmicutes)]
MFVRNERFNDFIRLYPAVTAVLAINTLLFLFVRLPLLPDGSMLQYVIGVNLYIKDGEIWRLITPIFVHMSFTHFIMNMFAVLIFGPAIEQALKPARFILFFLFCGIGANIITYFLKPLTYAHLGASGAIFGLLGFYLFYMIRHKGWMAARDRKMILMFTFCAFALSLIQPHVNMLAHAGGYFIGFLAARFFYRSMDPYL